ncbi:MAG TPA: LytTR family DNA-binding domain-containing protein [Acholeplasmataceae bacterium]|nr:LytTR family DNA-binding domain-containing protein [Acholeplasmataceae bacterium]
MKIKVKVVPELENIEVEIQCPKITPEVNDIERILSLNILTLQGKKDQRMYTLAPRDIYYFDALDHDVFAYTKDDIYEVNYKLYQLEDMLKDVFLRINKNTLVNPKMIKSFQSSINGRMEAELINKDRLVISRMYVKDLKAMLRGEKR